MTGHARSEHRATSATKLPNDVTAILNKNTAERFVVSDIDHLIDQIKDYRQDMPKALLPDEDEKITTGMYLVENVLQEDTVTCILNCQHLVSYWTRSSGPM